MVEHSQSPLRIKKIAALSVKDFRIRLRESRFGEFYNGYLKQYPLARRIALWIWKGYPFYVKHLASRIRNSKAKKPRALTKLSDFVGKRGLPTFKLADAVRVEMLQPEVFPTRDQDHLSSPDDQYKFPEIFVATISNALTYGGSNLVLVDGEVVCHDLYDFKYDYTSEELHCWTHIEPRARSIRWLHHDPTPDQIRLAATFVDACAFNYAHWMTEVLPRIALFCAETRFKDVPIVVDDGLHKNIMESLALVAGADREIIALPSGKALAVSELRLTSVAGYVPFDWRTAKPVGHSHGAFSLRALELLRNQLSALGHKTGEQAWPEKIYLRRISGVRRITNAAELEKLLTDRGFVAVEPEKMSFLQQVQLFSNAKQIVASTGASLTNGIFCRPGAHVIVLMAKHKKMIYRYWSNLLMPMGIRVSYVLCNISENPDLGIHADFEVNILDVIDALNAPGAA